MDVRRFTVWCRSASSAERAGAAARLAAAYAAGRLSADEIGDGEVVLDHLAQDPSPKVRLAVASGLAEAAVVPRRVLLSLCGDIDAVACALIDRSPAPSNDDLADLATDGSPAVRYAIAGRRNLSPGVAAALAEAADAKACARMLDNPDAAIGAAGFERIANRFGDDAAIRDRLLARVDLPATVRQSLVTRIGAALADAPFVVNLLGRERAEALVSRSCERATSLLLQQAGRRQGQGREDGQGERRALLEQLRGMGKLTTAFVLRLACTGQVDLLASALASLSRWPEERVRAVLADGRGIALRKLMKTAGIPASASPILQCATAVWRDVDRRRLSLDASSGPQRVLERFARTAPEEGRTASSDHAKGLAFVRRLANECVEAEPCAVPGRLAA